MIACACSLILTVIVREFIKNPKWLSNWVGVVTDFSRLTVKPNFVSNSCAAVTASIFGLEAYS